MTLNHIERFGNYIVAYMLEARTVEPEKQPLLGNGCVTRNNELTVGSCVSMRSLPMLYSEDQPCEL
jgi:hypothetical protein